jgi:hypothetical protein
MIGCTASAPTVRSLHDDIRPQTVAKAYQKK